jgi:hypothetical protein
MSRHEAPRLSFGQHFLAHAIEVFVCLFGMVIYIAMFAFAAGANAQDARPGDTAYYCERSGSMFWSVRRCEEIGGTELRRGVIADPSESRSPSPATVPVDERKSNGAPGHTTAGDAAQAKGASAESSAAKDEETMKRWQNSLFRMLGFAFVIAILAKLIGRSFFRWFFAGAGLHMVLVALNVISA